MLILTNRTQPHHNHILQDRMIVDFADGAGILSYYLSL